jgi:hypothetical protein
MWCVDGIASLTGSETFIEISDRAAMADDALLGMWVVILGLAAWVVCKIVTRSLTKSRTQH